VPGYGFWGGQRNWQKPDRFAKPLAGPIRLRHFREQRITIYELAA
jgi:hypothetical protein